MSGSSMNLTKRQFRIYNNVRRSVLEVTLTIAPEAEMKPLFDDLTEVIRHHDKKAFQGRNGQETYVLPDLSPRIHFHGDSGEAKS